MAEAYGPDSDPCDRWQGASGGGIPQYLDDLLDVEITGGTWSDTPPTVRSTSSGEGDPGLDGSAHNVHVTLPPSILGGDLILVKLAQDGMNLLEDGDSGFTYLGGGVHSSSQIAGGVFWKKAEGSLGAASADAGRVAEFHGTASLDFAWTAEAFQDAADPTVTPPILSSMASGTDDSCEPPIVNPGTTRHWYIQAFAACDRDDFTDWPDDLTDSELKAGTADLFNASAASAGLSDVEDSSYTPTGVFDMSASDEWLCWTIAISPALGGPADHDLLVYHAEEDLWLNTTAEDAGLLTGEHDHDDAYISIIGSPVATDFPEMTAGGELSPSGYGPSDFAADDHAHALDDLSDVDAAAPDDGDVLAWNDGDGEWQPVAPGSGGGMEFLEDLPDPGDPAEQVMIDDQYGRMYVWSPTGESYLDDNGGGYVMGSQPVILAGFDTFGMMMLYADVILDDWTPATDQTFLSRGVDDSEYDWWFGFTSDGYLAFRYTTDGTTVQELKSTVTLASAVTLTDGVTEIGVQCMAAIGAEGSYDLAVFYWDDDPGEWFENGNHFLGAPVMEMNGATNANNTSGAKLCVGAFEDGSLPFAGKMYHASLEHSSDGGATSDVVIRVDFDQWSADDSTFGWWEKVMPAQFYADEGWARVPYTRDAYPQIEGLRTLIEGLTLDGLLGVNAPAPDDDDVLTWDDAAGEWIAAPAPGGGGDLDDLGDVTIDTPTDGDLLVYVTDHWENQTLAEAGAAADDHDHDGDYIEAIAGTPTAGNFASITDGDTLADSGYDETSFATASHDHDSDYADIAHEHALDDLSDVAAAAPNDGDVLTWADGAPGSWQPVAPTGGAMALDDLTDVDTGSPTNGQTLLFFDDGWYAGAPMMPLDDLLTTWDNEYEPGTLAMDGVSDTKEPYVWSEDGVHCVNAANWPVTLDDEYNFYGMTASVDGLSDLGALTIEVEVRATDWSPATDMTIACRGAADDDYDWWFGLTSDGYLAFRYMDASLNVVELKSTVTLASAVTLVDEVDRLVLVLEASTGDGVNLDTADFSYRLSWDSGDTPLGTTVTDDNGDVTLNVAGDGFALGSFDNGDLPWAGSMYRVDVYAEDHAQSNSMEGEADFNLGSDSENSLMEQADSNGPASFNVWSLATGDFAQEDWWLEFASARELDQQVSDLYNFFWDVFLNFVMIFQTGQQYTTSNVTEDRAYDANSTTLDEIADVLGTLIADLQSAGIISS